MQESITAYLEECISFSLVRVCKAQRRQGEAWDQKIGLHAGQDLVLFRLLEEDGLSQSQLAALLGVEIATIAKMVHRMERCGLLILRQDIEDARVSRVYLTEKGRSLSVPALQVWTDLDACLLQGMNQAEQLLFRRLLIQAAANFSRS